MLTFGECIFAANVFLVDEKPFWVNPCGYLKKNEEPPITSLDVVKRVLSEANFNQNFFNQFKFEYIKELTGVEFNEHYGAWQNISNSWMTDELPVMPGEVLSKAWLESRTFPGELTFTFETLQRVAVGLEKTIDDAKKDNTFYNELLECKFKLKALLCEVSDGIEDMKQKRNPDIERKVIPDDIRDETNVGQRNFLNTIIFRDYIISIEYILQVYKYFQKSLEDL